MSIIKLRLQAQTNGKFIFYFIWSFDNRGESVYDRGGMTSGEGNMACIHFDDRISMIKGIRNSTNERKWLLRKAEPAVDRTHLTMNTSSVMCLMW